MKTNIVGRGRHKSLFSNLCCVLIVESLNGDQLYLDHCYHKAWILDIALLTGG